METQLIILTGTYNARRYGRPWIARVTFDDLGKPTYKWGYWTGEINGGTAYGGELLIVASEGDIVADGQKDHRGSNSYVRWWQVRNEELVYIEGGKAEAYRITKQAM